MSSNMTQLPTVAILRPGDRVHAVVRVVAWNGTCAVLKDFSSSRWHFRNIGGAFLAQREAAAYRRLQHVAGVPRLLGRVGRHGLLLEHIHGCNSRAIGAGITSAAFFEELRGILAAVRCAGVLHMDVKRNVLVSRDGRPFLIDFAASLVLPRWLGPIRRFLLRIAAAHDEREVLKLKRLIAPHLITPDDEVELTKPLPFGRLVFIVQESINRSLRWITGQQPAAFQPLEPTDQPHEMAHAT